MTLGLHEVGEGWLYCGKARLNIKRVGRCLEFRVKETWLRPSCGETVAIPVEEFVKLVDKMTEKARQQGETVLP